MSGNVDGRVADERSAELAEATNIGWIADHGGNLRNEGRIASGMSGVVTARRGGKVARIRRTGHEGGAVRASQSNTRATLPAFTAKVR
jgi:hypothetical protein